jgi:crotonobetainyl-CoA:carnitine CoA-transferase CaiB-like acyl-CoA transferase
MRIDLVHPVAGSVPGVRNPILYSRTPMRYERAPPLLGADTDAVLSEQLGLDAARLAELRIRGIIE